jgi:hypothetical protein
VLFSRDESPCVCSIRTRIFFTFFPALFSVSQAPVMCIWQGVQFLPIFCKFGLGLSSHAMGELATYLFDLRRVGPLRFFVLYPRLQKFSVWGCVLIRFFGSNMASSGFIKRGYKLLVVFGFYLVSPSYLRIYILLLPRFTRPARQHTLFSIIL